MNLKEFAKFIIRLFQMIKGSVGDLLIATVLIVHFEVL